MIPRTAFAKVSELAQHFKAVAIIGPRQSGKTTLTRSPDIEIKSWRMLPEL